MPLKATCNLGSSVLRGLTHDGDQVVLLLAGGDKSTQDADIRKSHRMAAE